MQPVYNKKALIVEDSLVISDLHIGIERELNAISQVEKMQGKILDMLRTLSLKNLIILGDLKHNIPNTSYQEYREVPRLIEELSKHADVKIIKGNHDGNIERLVGVENVFSEIVMGDILFIHGHTLPGCIDYRSVVIGHNHPCIEFKDSFGSRMRESVWIRANFNSKAGEFYGLNALPELVIMPAFNDLIAGTPFNRRSSKKLLGPFFRRNFVDVENAEAHLLDGTHLGRIGNLKTAN